MEIELLFLRLGSAINAVSEKDDYYRLVVYGKRQ